jgi:hypothetical protein
VKLLNLSDEFSICPGCGLKLLTEKPGLDARYNATQECRQLYDELAAFTLSLRDPDFPHQTVVDAYTAQHYGPNIKPIGICFALIGLYLTFERGYTGREAQLAHIELGKLLLKWNGFEPRTTGGAVTVKDVLGAISQDNYKVPIQNWGKSVWNTWISERPIVAWILEKYLK